MAYGNFKDLPRRTGSSKVLRDKAFNIVKNPNYDGYQRGVPSIVYTFFDKKSSRNGVNNKILKNQQLAEEFHKPIIKKLKKKKEFIIIFGN